MSRCPGNWLTQSATGFVICYFSPVNDAGTDGVQPIHDWREYTFSITDKHMPEWILQGLAMQGVRLSSVAYTLSPQGQFTYQIEGHLYAKE
ncbi:type 4b pilus protein PilO2 [Salmonella enterica]